MADFRFRSMQLGRLPGTSGLGPRNPCICGDFSNILLESLFDKSFPGSCLLLSRSTTVKNACCGSTAGVRRRCSEYPVAENCKFR